jgi:hypothetical protein
MFRPKLDVPKDKKPKAAEHVEKATCDDIEPAAPAGLTDLPTLEKNLEKAERKLNRARSRLEQIDGELLLSEDPDDVEDLREEQKDAKARKDRAMKDYEKAKSERDRAKARIDEEAKVEADMKAASEAEEKSRRDEAIQRAKQKAKALEEEEPPEEKAPEEPKKPVKPKIAAKAKPKEECEPVEVLEDEELGPMPKPRKSFKWTPKKAVAVGVLVGLVLPALLYGFVIPRADVTVRTWFNEGFLNAMTVDAKVINSGTVEVSNLDINISVMKDVKGVEVHVADLTGYSSSVGFMSEEKFSSITFHDDQNAKYILVVKISFDAGGTQITKSYTHRVNTAVMNTYFNDHIQEIAI